MSALPEENYESLVDELRAIQALIYKESAFIEYKNSELQDISSKLEKSVQKSQCILKYLTYFISNANNYKTNFYSFQIINSFFNSEDLSQISLDEAGDELSPFTSIAKMCLQNISMLSKVAIKCIELHPELNNTICYSVIPSIFGNMVTGSRTDAFHEFSKQLFSSAPGVAPRFISFCFMTPPVLEFVKCVADDIQSEITETEKFSDEFVASWKENASLMPKFIIDVLDDSSSPETLLFDLFIKQLIMFPKIYCISDNSALLDDDSASAILAKLAAHKKELWDACFLSPIHCNLPPNIDLAATLKKKFFLFSLEDMSVLAKFAEVASELGFFTIETPKVQCSKKALIFVDKEPEESHASFSTTDGNNEEDLECSLRNVLLQCPRILKVFDTAPEHNLFAELLKMRSFVPDDQRMRLELKIKQIQKIAGDKFDFRSLLDLLNDKIKRRSDEHKESLMKIASMNRMLNYFQEISKKNNKTILSKIAIVRFFMVAEWQKETSTIKDIQDEVFNSQDSFMEYFENISNLWNQWLKSKKYFCSNDAILVLSIIMEHIPLSLYQEHHKELIEKDNMMYDIMKNRNEEAIALIKDSFLEKFISRPELLNYSLVLFQKSLTASNPVRAAHFMKKMFHELAFVTETEVKVEAGENEFTPLRLLVIILSEPKELFSFLSYIAHFLYPLYEDPKIMEVITISEALIGHFNEILDKLSAKKDTIEDQQESNLASEPAK